MSTSNEQAVETHGEVTGSTAPALSAKELSEVLTLLPGADSVELKVTVSDVRRRSVVQSLGMDILDAEIRQVVFFDTPQLALNRGGLVVRARRIQGRPGDSVVKLRPVKPADLPSELRRTPGFGVEIDAMPGGFVCSGRLKASVKDSRLREVFAGSKPLEKLLTREQQALFGQHAPEGVGLGDLQVLGPINILKLKFAPEGYGRPMVAELWFYPDGSQILELSAKCTPAEAWQVSAESKAFLSDRGVDLGAPQATKTRTALSFFATVEP